MVTERLPSNDPRTIARDIPGLLDVLFPHLVPGFVTHLNRTGIQLRDCEPVPLELVATSGLQRAMLFEIAVALGEQLISDDGSLDWEACLSIAASRQRQHFDAKVPSTLSAADKDISLRVARNLVTMLRHLQADPDGEILQHSPMIPGFQWIASGNGDFSLGENLIEVKCTNRRFSSADYRQMAIYWLLSYCASLEGKKREWSKGILLNPRLNLIVSFTFSDFIQVVSGGRSKVELFEIFSAMVEGRSLSDCS